MSKVDELPFRLEKLGAATYLVEDAGDRMRALIDCPNRMASPAEVAMWNALQPPPMEGSPQPSRGKRV